MGPIDAVAGAARAVITAAVAQKRIKADITLREFYGTVVAVFMMGTLFGWGAFGQLPFPKEALEKSSLADFLAAAGTWAIGVGAIWFARESHNQRLIETYFAELERSTSMNRRLTMIQIACASTSNPKAELDVLLNSDFDINRAVRRSVNTLIADTNTFVLAPAEIAVLHTNSQLKYASTRNRLDAVRIAAEMFLIALPDDIKRPKEGLAELMRTDLKPLADAAATSGDELAEMVSKQISEIRWPKAPSVLQD